MVNGYVNRAIFGRLYHLEVNRGLSPKWFCQDVHTSVLKKTVQKRFKGRTMFGFKSKKEKLEAKHQRLLEEAYKLSHVNRGKSDAKLAEAAEIEKQLDALE